MIAKNTTIACIYSLVGVWVYGETPQERPVSEPNIIYIFPDQMRNAAMGIWQKSPYKDSVRFTGDPVYTPNLDKFAEESIVLTSAMSNNPVSSPHRGSLMTGMFSENNGVPVNCSSNRPFSSLRTDVMCISDVLKEAGYSCGYIGKYHMDHPTPNDPQRPGNYVGNGNIIHDAYTPKEKRHGFDFWYSYGTYNVFKHPHYWDSQGVRHEINEWSPNHETDKAIEFLRNENHERKKDRPFFLMVSYNPPHTPNKSLDDCMEEDYNLYKDKSISELLIRPNVDLSMKRTKSAPYYFAQITGIDRNFGRLLKELEHLGLTENTIVIFSSDHGDTMCSQGVEDPKNSPYSESFNVPFIVRYPGVLKPGIDTELILSTPDIMPTILGLCNLKGRIPGNVEGRNYAAWLIERSREVPLRNGALYLRNSPDKKVADKDFTAYFPVARGIKTYHYTLALTIDKVTRKLESVLFYDDINDPYQMAPLDMDSNKKVLKDLYKEMAKLLKEANDPWYKQRILDDLIPYED